MAKLDDFVKDEQEIDRLDKFGEEIAGGLREIQDQYRIDLAMRDIRDIVFKAKYPQHE